MDRRDTWYGSVVGLISIMSSPGCLLSISEPSQGPLVTKVRPCFRPECNFSGVVAPTMAMNTRFIPIGPRNEAEFAIASVRAPAGIRKARESRRDQMSAGEG